MKQKVTNPVGLYLDVIEEYINNNLFDIAADKVLLLSKSFDIEGTLFPFIITKIEALTSIKRDIFIKELIYTTYQTAENIGIIGKVSYRNSYNQIEKFTLFCRLLVKSFNHVIKALHIQNSLKETNKYIEYALKISVLNYDLFDYFLDNLYNLKRIDEVIRLIELELEKNRDDPIFLCLLGMAYIKDYQVGKAENILCEAHKLDPRNGKVLHKLTTIYHYTRQYDKMEQTLLKESEIYPNDPYLLYSLSTVYLETKRFKKAEKILSKANELHPKKSFIIGNIGRLYLENKEYKKAKEAFEEARRLDPLDFNILTKLGYFYIAISELDKAEKVYLEAINLRPNNPLNLMYLGTVYYLKGNYIKSKQRLEEASLIDPYHAGINCNLALVHFQLGEISIARQYIKIANQLDPKNESILRNYEIIMGVLEKTLMWIQ